MTTTKPSVSVNGTDFRWPLRPVVVVCIDGGDPRTLRQFLADGCIPTIARVISQGFACVADGSMPSFTCPNNMSLITGTSAADHDLSGLQGDRLRSDGGVSETKVPFILNRPLNDAYKAKATSQPLKSWQLFDYAINGTL